MPSATTPVAFAVVPPVEATSAGPRDATGDGWSWSGVLDGMGDSLPADRAAARSTLGGWSRQREQGRKPDVSHAGTYYAVTSITHRLSGHDNAQVTCHTLRRESGGRGGYADRTT